MAMEDYLQYCSEIRVYTNLRMTDIKVFVRADTSYGSYCVDEIAAEYVETDSLIHFDDAFCSRISRLSVFYMYTQCPFDIQNMIVRCPQ